MHSIARFVRGARVEFAMVGLATAAFTSSLFAQTSGRSGDRADAARALVEAHCGGCHSGETGPVAPGQKIRLARWLRDERVTKAGDPDRSRLFWAFLDRHELAADNRVIRGGTRPQLTSSELMTVRAWLSSLKPHGGGRRPSLGDVDIKPIEKRYRIGDEMRFVVTARRACRLTLININGEGIATVVFPNAFAQSTDFAAGESVRIPAVDAGYLFRASRRGRERLVAFCATGPGAILGIHHEFAHQRFTVLGPWERFLAGVVGDDGNGRAGRLERRWRTARRCRWVRRQKGRRGRRGRRRVCRSVRQRVTVRVQPPQLAPFGQVDVVDIEVR